MTSWDINPSGVQQVLKATHAAALPLQEHAKLYGVALEGAVPEVGDYVGLALSDFASKYQYAFADISAQVLASLNGAADATVAYLNGQHDMALAAQRGSRDAAYKASEARRKAPGGAAGDYLGEVTGGDADSGTGGG